jgi:hypothetical protein
MMLHTQWMLPNELWSCSAALALALPYSTTAAQSLATALSTTLPGRKVINMMPVHDTGLDASGHG